MKTFSISTDSHPRRQVSAFTLVEMIIGMGIFMVIFVGVMTGLQLFGMRVYTLAATKLSATADVRKSLNILHNEIRSAKIVYVGNYANGAFSRIADGQPQTGNALEIFSTNTTPAVYYQSSSGSANALYAVRNGTVNRIANYVTNYYVFTAEDYLSQTLSNYDNNPVIRLTLQFYQWEYPIGIIGTNGINAYNFYRLQTRVSRRTKE